MTATRQPIRIIAEAGVNHDGDMEIARELVRAAARTGADVVKFQTFLPELSLSGDTPKADYQKTVSDDRETMLEMVRKLALPLEAFATLAALAHDEGIAFASTAFDMPSLHALLRLDPPFLKVPSGELTNAPFLLAMARTGKPLLVSTGMAGLDEVAQALGVIAFGLTADEATPPSVAAFAAAAAGDAGRDVLADRVTLLHCTSQYPAPAADLNLNAMTTMRGAFGLKVGYSDHSTGTHVAVAAAALGATVIEKHFTLDRTAQGPDHAASLEPKQFASMVAEVRDVEAALGSGEKIPAACERTNRDLMRKSLVAARPIRAGEAFSPENLTVKRPGTGLAPVSYWATIGTTADRDYAADELIEPHAR